MIRVSQDKCGCLQFGLYSLGNSPLPGYLSLFSEFLSYSFLVCPPTLPLKCQQSCVEFSCFTSLISFSTTSLWLPSLLRAHVITWGPLDNLRRQWHPTPVLLPGKIPWTGEPGGLQSMGSLRVGHDWVTSLSLSTFMCWRRKWQPTPVFLPGESQGRGSLVGCCLWGRTELDTTEAT